MDMQEGIIGYQFRFQVALRVSRLLNECNIA